LSKFVRLYDQGDSRLLNNHCFNFKINDDVHGQKCLSTFFSDIIATDVDIRDPDFEARSASVLKNADNESYEDTENYSELRFLEKEKSSGVDDD